MIRSADLLFAELECSLVLADLQELRDTLLIRSKSGHLSDDLPYKSDTLAAPLHSSMQALSCIIAAVLQAQCTISLLYIRSLRRQRRPATASADVVYTTDLRCIYTARRWAATEQGWYTYSFPLCWSGNLLLPRDLVPFVKADGNTLRRHLGRYCVTLWPSKRKQRLKGA